MKRILLSICVLAFCNLSVNADELVSGFEEKDLPVLNEEMRKQTDDIRNNSTDITDNSTYITTNTTNIATNTASIVSEGIKAWASITYSGGTPTLQDSYNVYSISDTAMGEVTINWDTDFSSVNYCVVGNVKETNGTATLIVQFRSVTTSAVIVQMVSIGGPLTDPQAVYVMAIGDQ